MENESLLRDYRFAVRSNFLAPTPPDGEFAGSDKDRAITICKAFYKQCVGNGLERVADNIVVSELVARKNSRMEAV